MTVTESTSAAAVSEAVSDLINRGALEIFIAQMYSTGTPSKSRLRFVDTKLASVETSPMSRQAAIAAQFS